MPNPMPNSMNDTLEADIAELLKPVARQQAAIAPYCRRRGGPPPRPNDLAENDDLPHLFLGNWKRENQKRAARAESIVVPVNAGAIGLASGSFTGTLARVMLVVAAITGACLFFSTQGQAQQLSCGTITDAANCEAMTKALQAKAVALRDRLGGPVPSSPAPAVGVGHLPSWPTPEPAKVQERIPVQQAAPSPVPQPAPIQVAQLDHRKPLMERRSITRAERAAERRAALKAKREAQAAARAKARAAAPVGSPTGTLTISSGGEGANCKLPTFKGAKGLKTVGAGQFQCGKYSYDTRTEQGKGFEQEAIFTKRRGKSIIKIRAFH